MVAARDVRIDNAKGALIVLVVMGHFLLPIANTWFNTGCLYLIYSFHMPCFVFLSGYLSKGIYRGKGTYRWDRLGKLVWLFKLVAAASLSPKNTAAIPAPRGSPPAILQAESPI